LSHLPEDIYGSEEMQSEVNCKYCCNKWLGLTWLIASLLNGINTVTRWETPQKRIPKPITPRAEEDCPDCCQTDAQPELSRCGRCLAQRQPIPQPSGLR
jgi:hypothetical protein